MKTGTAIFLMGTILLIGVGFYVYAKRKEDENKAPAQTGTAPITTSQPGNPNTGGMMALQGVASLLTGNIPGVIASAQPAINGIVGSFGPSSGPFAVSILPPAMLSGILSSGTPTPTATTGGAGSGGGHAVVHVV